MTIEELKRENRRLRILVAAMLDQVGGRIEVTDQRMACADPMDLVYWYDNDRACGVYTLAGVNDESKTSRNST